MNSTCFRGTTMTGKFVIFLLVTFYSAATCSALKIEINPPTFTEESKGPVHISCFPDAIGTGDVYHMWIERNDEKPIVSLRATSGIEYGTDTFKPAEMLVDGVIDNDVSKSYLRLSLPHPSEDDQGLYSCVLVFSDESGYLKKRRASRNLTVEDPFQKFTLASGAEFWYYIPGHRMNYYGARTYCHSLGGYLLHYDSVEEHDAVKSAIDNQHDWSTYTFLFVGAYQLENEGIWVTEKYGNPIDVSKWLWSPGQPDDFMNNEDCGSIYAHSALFNDLPCYQEIPFICERTPK